MVRDVEGGPGREAALAPERRRGGEGQEPDRAPPPPAPQADAREEEAPEEGRDGDEPEHEPGPGRVGDPAGAPGQEAEAGREARQGEARDLPPDRPPLEELAGLVALLAGGAADLAARGLGHGVGGAITTSSTGTPRAS